MRLIEKDKGNIYLVNEQQALRLLSDKIPKVLRYLSSITNKANFIYSEIEFESCFKDPRCFAQDFMRFMQTSCSDLFKNLLSHLVQVHQLDKVIEKAQEILNMTHLKYPA